MNLTSYRKFSRLQDYRYYMLIANYRLLRPNC